MFTRLVYICGKFINMVAPWLHILNYTVVTHEIRFHIFLQEIRRVQLVAQAISMGQFHTLENYFNINSEEEEKHFYTNCENFLLYVCVRRVGGRGQGRSVAVHYHCQKNPLYLIKHQMVYIYWTNACGSIWPTR